MTTTLTQHRRIPGIAWAGLAVLVVAFFFTILSDTAAHASEEDVPAPSSVLARVLDHTPATIADVVAPVGDVIPPAVSAIATIVDDAIPQALDTVVEVRDAAVDTVGTVTQHVTDAIAPLPGSTPVTQIVDAVVGGATQLLTDTTDVVVAAVPAAPVQPVADLVTDIVADLPSDIGADLPPVVTIAPIVTALVSEGVPAAADAVTTPTTAVAPLALWPAQAAVAPITATAAPAPSPLTAGILTLPTPPAAPGASSSASAATGGAADTPANCPPTLGAAADSGRTGPTQGTALPASPVFDTDVSPD